MRKENKLPAKNNKVKRAIWMFLASIGIASSVPNSAIASDNQNINTEKDYNKDGETNRYNDFYNSLKVNLPIQRQVDYKKKSLDVVKEKGFNSSYKKGNEIALSQVSRLFDQIEKNTPRYASLKGINDTEKYTQNFEQDVYDIINYWLKDLVYVQGEYDKNDPHWKKIGKANSGITFYDSKEIIVNPKKDKHSGTTMHEITHSMQKHVREESEYLPNYSRVCYAISEGMSAEYGKRVENINDNGTEYPTDYFIYNISNFLSGGNLEKWKQGEYKGDLYDVFSNSLDNKYGNRTGEKLYTLVANASKYSSQYVKPESLEENKKKQTYIEAKIQQIIDNKELSEDKKNRVIERLNSYLECNKNYYNSLKESIVKNNRKDSLNQDLKKLNEFSLELIEKDINAISTKDEAQQVLINWNLYKATCMISNDNKRGTEISTNKYVPKAEEVQNLLFEKCKETKLLDKNINKGVFTAVLDSNINDISNVTIVKQKNKLIVMDKYAINTLKAEYDNTVLGNNKKEGKKISTKNKMQENTKSYILETVENYTKGFAQDIKGEHINWINEEKDKSTERFE